MPERRGGGGGGGGTDAAVTATTIRPGNATAKKKLNGREEEGDGKKRSFRAEGGRAGNVFPNEPLPDLFFWIGSVPPHYRWGVGGGPPPKCCAKCKFERFFYGNRQLARVKVAGDEEKKPAKKSSHKDPPFSAPDLKMSVVATYVIFLEDL